MDLSLTKQPWYAQIGVFVGLAAAGLGVYYAHYDAPARAEMQLRQGQLKALRTDVEKGRTTAKKLPDVRRQVEGLEGRLEGLRAVLPEERDAADLLRRMQTVAAESNLTINSFKPAPILTRQLHAEWPIALELEGTYHNLATFLDRVGKFTQIVNVSALHIKGTDKPAPNSTITATCVATTFVLLEKPNPTKPDPAKLGATPTPSRPTPTNEGT